MAMETFTKHVSEDLLPRAPRIMDKDSEVDA